MPIRNQKLPNAGFCNLFILAIRISSDRAKPWLKKSRYYYRLSTSNSAVDSLSAMVECKQEEQKYKPTKCLIVSVSFISSERLDLIT